MQYACIVHTQLHKNHERSMCVQTTFNIFKAVKLLHCSLVGGMMSLFITYLIKVECFYLRKVAFVINLLLHLQDFSLNKWVKF